MSLLGFDALGRLALGQLPDSHQIFLPAISGSFAVTGSAATFTITEAAASGALSINGAATFAINEAVSAASFAWTGVAAPLIITENAVSGSFIITGSLSNNISGAAEAGAFHLTGVNTDLIWTGAGIDNSYTGGVGHYLEELEQQKRLNAITRKIPGPVDRRTVPRFEPLRGPPSAPIVPAPDVVAVPSQAMAAAAAQAEAAKKRRRDEEALLLLAS